MRVVITGAAGQIGREMVQELSDSHELYLIDRHPVPGRSSIIADLARNRVAWQLRLSSLSKLRRWRDAFEGAEVVLHLAAAADPEATWRQVLHHNIQATWNVFQAAEQHRVSRVVYASSNWAVKALERELAPACYTPGGPKIGSEVPPRPIAPYGITKACGEIIGRTFVDEQTLSSFVAVRIGWYHPSPPRSEEYQHLGIGAKDLRSLLRRCVEAKFEGFHVVYGVSAQPTAPYDLSHTRRLLSWEPQEVL